LEVGKTFRDKSECANAVKRWHIKKFFAVKGPSFMPCLFPGIHFPGNHFPHFPMFGKHKENQSKETQFQSTKK
jgi:hypothetical protein